MAEVIRQIAERSHEIESLPVGDMDQRSSPLSLSQHQLWLSEQIDPGNTAYHIAELYSLKGDLQTELLERAFNEIISRHEVLRTVFSVHDGEPVQIIRPHLRLQLPIVDLSGFPEIDRDDEIHQRVTPPFDLCTGTLVRPTLLRLDETQHYLSLVVHHIVSDGWSLGVLMRELEKIYTSLVRGEPEPLPELPIQYADFVSRQRERMCGAEMERHLEYWRQRLAGAPPLLELPNDYPRPSIRSSRGARVKLRLDDQLAANVRQLGARAGGTLFMTLLTGFKILMSRYTAREDVIVGIPVAGRGYTAVEALIGLFINTLVVRTDLSGNPSFLDVFKRVREGFLYAYEHQDVPIETLVSELKIERSLSHTPLVQVVFNMLSFAVPTVSLPGLEVKRLPSPETGSKLDLTLYAHDSSAGLHLTLSYSTDLFSEARMRELLAQFAYLLEQIVKDPARSIAEYSFVTPATRSLLPDPAGPLESEWRGACHELFTRQARETPTHPALIDANGIWTYKQLDEQSDRLTQYLLAAGIRRGDRVAIYAHRSAPLICAMLGILKASAAFVILDPAYPEQRLVEYLRLVKPRALVHLDKAGPLPPALFAEELCRLTLDPSMAISGSITTTSAEYAPVAALGPSDLAYVAFTSGSTGKPRGVMGTHDSLAHYPFWLQKTFGIGAEDRFSMLSALSHDPLLRDIFTPLLMGAVLCIPEPELFEEPGALGRWLRDREISVCNLTPAMGQLLGVLPQDVQLKHLRHSFFAGESLTWRHVSQFRELAPASACVNLYGATETQRALGYYIAQQRDDRSCATEVLPVGKGMTGVQLLVLNARHNLAGCGETGEICFRSPHLANGYWNDPAQTAARFVPNPFSLIAGERLYRSGDFGRYLPDGNIELLGRADRQVQIRGFRVEPDEVRGAIKEQEGIRDCVVVGCENGNGDKQLTAYVTPARGVALSVGDLTQNLRRRLPAYMIPSTFVILEDLPLTPNGKIDYHALPAASQLQPQLERGEIDTPVEAMIAGMWAHLLKVEQVGPHDNFFDLGGHSLLAMQLLARMRSTLRVTLTLRDLFETPTVAGLAGVVEKRLSSATAGIAAIPRLQSQQAPPLSFSQEGLLVREWWEEINKAPRRPSQLAAAIRLTGPLNLQLLEQAINQIVARHEILRATFPRTRSPFTWKGLRVVLRTFFTAKAVQNRLIKLEYRGAAKLDAPRFSGGRKQIIRRQMTVPLSVIHGLSEEEGTRILTDEAAAPFDYDAGPLMRVNVIRLADEEYVVQFVVHHLICDAWSMRVLIREVLTAYTALAEGTACPLPELPLQYADFARWQRKWLRGEGVEALIAFWKEQVSGVGLFPKLPLPFVRSQHAKFTPSGVETKKISVPLAVTKSLKSLAHAQGATTYMLFMAALNVLLHRYTGVPKVSIYTPFANRSRVETHGLIGWVSNVHVVSVDCSGNPAFLQLLERVREVVLSAYTYQEVPYLQLVKTLLLQDNGYTIPRSVSNAPYVFFDYVVQSQRPQPVGDLTLRPFKVPAGSAAAGNAGLEMRALEHGDELIVTIRYSPNVADAADIEQMLSKFSQLLHGIARSPEERILDLPLS